jgi:hypothetical protein
MNTTFKRRQLAARGTVQYGRQGRVWLGFGLLIGSVGTLVCGNAAEAQAAIVEKAPNLRIRVNNYARVSPTTLNASEREAGRILGQAGLRTEWVNCPGKGESTSTQNPCNEPLESTDIVLRLIPESTNNQYQDSVFGFAVVPIVASVYVNYAVNSARRDNAEFEIPMVLGTVIAHEIGHLLLGLNSHSVTGIMQKRWERNQVRQAVTGNLLFTGEQGTLMQVEMQRRARIQTAVNR